MNKVKHCKNRANLDDLEESVFLLLHNKSQKPKPIFIKNSILTKHIF